jgi:hypothetical protein
MKHLIIIVATLTCFSAGAQSGVDAMAKQRARDVANQNNNRIMQNPGAAPAPRPVAPTPAMTPTPLTPGQQAYANFQAGLFGINSNSPPEAKQTLAKELGNVAQGANKPAPATVSKLSDHLTAAMAEAKLTTPRKTRLAQDVAVLLNSAATPPAQKQAMIQDVQSILQSGGSSSENAAAVAADLQTVTDEVKSGAK